MKQIAQIEESFKRQWPDFSSGDTIRVHVKIKEGDKERIQVFQGTVIGRRGGGTGATFTVRKISSGIGVERVFPLHSPNIDKIEVVRKGHVRRKKLYYLRELTGKSARIKEELTDAQKGIETEAPGTAAEAQKQAAEKAKAKEAPAETEEAAEPTAEVEAEAAAEGEEKPEA